MLSGHPIRTIEVGAAGLEGSAEVYGGFGMDNGGAGVKAEEGEEGEGVGVDDGGTAKADAPAHGMGSALDTLCGQSYGAKQYHMLGLGKNGAALANSISYWINATLLALYVKFSPACKKTWTGFSKEALHNVPNFIRLAIPSAVMLCLEIWSFELMVLLSGLLPNPKLETSVLSTSLNTTSILYMIPFGLSSAISTRVSNELGAGRPQTAQSLLL
ncbi:hypothetical protein MRB53_031440 [Persea americana]|uniref:Uncharacterized protein n=1 Tax=Persea americana TaxID=3435 RepID=A0ACC2KPY3_PERAE|nr:hypothetical protein MRB53_031440 [Persea americana]